MADSATLVTFRIKRQKIAAVIKHYERQLNQARIDYAHINAAIRIFETDDLSKTMPRYIDIPRLFSRKEKMDLCKAALAELDPLSTKQLGAEVVRRKGMNPDDKVLTDAITHFTKPKLRLPASFRGVRLRRRFYRLPSSVRARPPETRRYLDHVGH